jgi:MinD-like ATPase involved in chromosome partitioning or flagellar assembly
MSDKLGNIVSFYSYKGGTGRTMALSNVAWVLASNGCDVLVIDWDLEAPGLHRYFRPFLIDYELTATPGLIDFVWDAAKAYVTPTDGPTTISFPTLEDYTVGLDWDFGERGSISFIPAGRQDENYAQRVNTFNWDNFYERLGGGKILEAERERLRASYDYILIDSRTGVSDTASICTVHMPDMLVVFFTLNRQSIKGTAAVTQSIRSQRAQIPVFPVPTRIENTETDKRDAALAYARRIFAPFLLHVQTHASGIDLRQQAQYWNQVETPYRAFYAFEEVPAAFKDEPGSRNSLLAPIERIAYWISDSRVSKHRPVDEARRAHIVNAFAFTEREDAGAEPVPTSLQAVSRTSK